jgi:hypothetical protein
MSKASLEKKVSQELFSKLVNEAKSKYQSGGNLSMEFVITSTLEANAVELLKLHLDEEEFGILKFQMAYSLRG